MFKIRQQQNITEALSVSCEWFAKLKKGEFDLENKPHKCSTTTRSWK